MNFSRGWLLAAGASAALAAVACGILFFLKRQKIREARAAAVRKHRREQWMQDPAVRRKNSKPCLPNVRDLPGRSAGISLARQEGQ